MTFARRPRKDASPLDENSLYEYAVKALGRRMRSVAELQRLMRPKVETGEAGENKVSAVVARLKEDRYLDDTAFASAYVRLRQENDGLGKLRVGRELTRKGIHRELIESAIDAAYASLSEEDLARRYLARKHIAKPQNAKEIARVVRRLAGAGFSLSILSKILKSWDIELSEEDLAAPEQGAEHQEE